MIVVIFIIVGGVAVVVVASPGGFSKDTGFAGRHVEANQQPSAHSKIFLYVYLSLEFFFLKTL